MNESPPSLQIVNLIESESEERRRRPPTYHVDDLDLDLRRVIVTDNDRVLTNEHSRSGLRSLKM